MQVKVNIDTTRAHAVLGRVPSRLEVELHRSLVAFGGLHLRNMALRMRSGITSGFGQQTQRRTGLLERSFQSIVRRVGTIAGLALRVFSAGNKYATLQQYGGVVRAKRGKYLAIPQEAVKTPAGVPRYASPRNYPGKTFVMRDGRGRLWIAEKKGKGRAARIVFLWQLVKSVTIRGNLNWFQQWRQDAQSRRAILNAGVKRAVDAAVRK